MKALTQRAVNDQNTHGLRTMHAQNDTTTTDSIELSTDADTADLVDAIESLAASNRQLAERVDRLESENREQAARIDELEAELAETKTDLDTVEDELEEAQEDLEEAKEHRSRMARGHAQTRGRVSDLESDLANGDTESRIQEVEETIQTPLERTVAYAEELAQEELSPNQQRARWIAQDLRDYASPTSGGYVLASSDIKTVLAAMDESTHDQTVSRVIEFFDDLGKEEVSVAKRRGSKRVLFSEEILQRLEELSDEAITSCVMAQPLKV